MPLVLNLKPGERIIINGCAIRNANRRSAFTIESQNADIVRGKDLIDADEATTPVKRVYFLIQTVLTDRSKRDKFVPVIQQQLAILATVFGPANAAHVFRAANHVSKQDYYRALAELRPLIAHEKVLLESSMRRADVVREAMLEDGPA